MYRRSPSELPPSMRSSAPTSAAVNGTWTTKSSSGAALKTDRYHMRIILSVLEASSTSDPHLRRPLVPLDPRPLLAQCGQHIARSGRPEDDSSLPVGAQAYPSRTEERATDVFGLR